jgi:uncharacterized peroxidase-related enzyme
MTHLPSLPSDAKLLDVFRAYPAPAAPLLDYHEVVMRGESPLSQSERELIAAYVSGLNACDYCFGVHRTTAQAFGIEEGLLASVLDDIETADIDERMRPLLWYVEKVTKEPARVSPADAQRVLDAGWDEQVLHDAVSVCALFNFMNRFVSGLGVSAGEDYFEVSGNRLADDGYAGLKKLL